jgi:hypothetical protein
VNQVARQQPRAERHRRDHLEIDDRLQPDPADFGGVPHRADAMHDRAEDDRYDHHLDERDERVAERLKRGSGVGPERPEQQPEDNCDNHLDVKLAP